MRRCLSQSPKPEYWHLPHCVKNAQIWSFFWSVFSCIRENMDQKNLRIWALFTQCLVELTNKINSSFENGCFPEKLKLAEVLPIFKKKDSVDKENIELSVKSFWKINVWTNWRLDYMNDKLSPLLTDFRKNHNNQLCLSIMLEKWRKNFGKGKFVGVVFMDLSKTFDSINYNLLVAQLFFCSQNFFQLMRSYLKNLKQRV